jgi:hypothetical protein
MKCCVLTLYFVYANVQFCRACGSGLKEIKILSLDPAVSLTLLQVFPRTSVINQKQLRGGNVRRLRILLADGHILLMDAI